MDTPPIPLNTTFDYISNNTTEFLAYDNMGNLLGMKNPRGHEWEFEYDDAGRLISVTDPLTNKTSYEYDGANNRTAIINTHLKRFEFEYDDHNNMIRAIDPYEKYITTDYNTDSLPVQMTDQEGKLSNIEYDNETRLIKTTDGAGNETTYHYDESKDTDALSDRPVRIDYPTFTRHFDYDKLQRIIKQTDDLKNGRLYSREFQYDLSGNVVSVKDEAGKETRFEYDAMNRIIKVTDPIGGIIQRTYDNRGNLTEIRDPKNQTTYYEYDKNNRLIRVTKPLFQETTYEYDAVGNVTAINDARGQRIEYTYNAVNRLTQVHYFSSADYTTPAKTVVFTYDDLGNLTGYDDGETSAVYGYDDLSQKTSEAISYGTFSLSYSYTYYANGLKKTFTGPDDIEYTYIYDENNRLRGVGIPNQGTITNNAFQWNSPAKTVLPGGSSTEYTYDPLMQINGIDAKDPGQNSYLARSYDYSPVGNITEKYTEHGAYTYDYDDLYRLTSAVNPTLTDEAYTYDSVGNRLSSAAVIGDWTYNANNELQGYGADASFAYDAGGNMTQKAFAGDIKNLFYDVGNRLIRVENENSAIIAKYYYDPFGRRLWKEVDGNRTYFLYSDEGLIGEYDSSGQEIKTYGYAPDSLWNTDPLFIKTGGAYYWYQNDHTVTPQKLVATNGLVVWDGTYDSFGNCQIETESVINNLRFPGQYYDAETGFYYNGHRYYDPSIGRYLRTDPFGDGLNLFVYCSNNPIRFLDPLGLCSIPDSNNNTVEYRHGYPVTPIRQQISQLYKLVSKGSAAAMDFLFPEDNRTLAEKIQAQVQWQVGHSGLNDLPSIATETGLILGAAGFGLAAYAAYPAVMAAAGTPQGQQFIKNGTDFTISLLSTGPPNPTIPSYTAVAIDVVINTDKYFP